MPYNQDGMVRDKDGIVSPQYYNKTTDQYEVQEGENGASKVMLSGRNVRKAYSRTVLTMQGQSIAAGATLSQNLDLSGYDKAIFAATFATAFTGSITLTNQVGSLWTAPSTANLSSATSGQTSNAFTPIAERQAAVLINSGASPVLINVAEVIAQ